jgi:hypothetical protein
MKKRPFVCPECGVTQENRLVRGTWFPCRNCQAHLQPAQSWKDRIVWVGMVLAIVVIVMLKLSWWISILLWLPTSFVIAVALVLLTPDPPIESDKPRSRPGSTLGL